MVNIVGADAQISVMYAKYHYLFWRPVTAIDPTSVKPDGDGFGPTPGFDDGNAADDRAGRLAAADRDAEPSGVSGCTRLDHLGRSRRSSPKFLGTGAINVDIHGFDPSGRRGT